MTSPDRSRFRRKAAQHAVTEAAAWVAELELTLATARESLSLAEADLARYTTAA